MGCVGERRGVYRVVVGGDEGKKHLENLNVNERIIF